MVLGKRGGFVEDQEEAKSANEKEGVGTSMDGSARPSFTSATSSANTSRDMPSGFLIEGFEARGRGADGPAEASIPRISRASMAGNFRGGR